MDQRGEEGDLHDNNVGMSSLFGLAVGGWGVVRGVLEACSLEPKAGLYQCRDDHQCLRSAK